MKKTLTTRLLSLLLCMVLCLSMAPAVSAAEAEEPVPAAVTEEPIGEPVDNTPAEKLPEEEGAEEITEEEAPVREPAEELFAEDALVREPEEKSDEGLTEEPAEEETSEIGIITRPLRHATVPDSHLSSEELFNGYAQQELNSLKPQGASIQAYQGGRLTGPAKVVYTRARALAKAVAAGGQTSTVLSIPVETVYGKTTLTAEDLGVAIWVNGGFNRDIFNVLDDMAITDVVDALLADCPYDLYWFDKTVGYSYGLDSGVSPSSDHTYITLSGNYIVQFSVNADYAPGNQEGGFEVDPTYGNQVQAAVANAQQIVADAADKSDYEKLVYYRDRICTMTEYNDDAAAGRYTYGYGNPWQLIWVLDGDESTKVVCEGYSKAFQYLCDLSTFFGVSCYSVYGDFTDGAGNGGAHMWNVVRMPDGRNYLVDVTNCDGDPNGGYTVGYPDELFLKGYSSVSGSYDTEDLAYTFVPNGSSITYTYYSDPYYSDIYSIYAKSQLLLSDTDYNPNGTPASETGIVVDEVNFTDANFRAWVSQNADTDHSGILSEAEVDAVTSIDVSNQQIADLKGIEFFSALETLNCSGNQLMTLDVSGNSALTSLDCEWNQLTELDLSANSALTYLECSYNQLTELDLSANSAIDFLGCRHNQLSELDLSANSALTSLSCGGNQLSALDLSANTALTSLDCEGNQLTELDLSANTALTSLSCHHTQLTELDLSANTALTSLFCHTNQLTELDLSANTALTSLSCGGNQLSALDLSANTALTSLWCYNNQLAALDLGANSALEVLFCNGNQLTTLDISGCPHLITVVEQGTRTEDETTVTYGLGEDETSFFVKIDASTQLVTEAIDTNLKFASRSITLQNNLQVNYKVEKSVIDDGGYTDPYVVFNMDGTEVTVTGALDSANSYYVFSFRNIAPHRINDSFTATLYATLDGELHTGVTLSYSISQYCYNQLNKLSAQSEFATLLVDLLNYGAQSQVYTGHNTGNLANAQLTTEQAAWGTSADPTYTTVQDTQYETVEAPSVTWKALGLYLEDTVSIRLKLAVEDTTGLTIRVRDDKGHTWSYDASALKATGDQYYFYFSGLNADQMRETVYITAYRDDAAVSNTVRYSIESYCKAKAGGEDALSQLLNAMMKYGDSAYNYAH